MSVMAAPNEQREWLSPKEVAAEVGLHVQTVYELVRDGFLKADQRRPGCAIRIPRHELRRAYPNLYGERS